jgi:hypothetical protein
VQDLLNFYLPYKEQFAKPIFEMTAHIDFTEPGSLVPMKLYNEVCSWVEKNIGTASIAQLGTAIGERAYDHMKQSGGLGEKATPLEILAELKRTASILIQDPLNRGWEFIEKSDTHAVMRRTQTFNCILQETLLKSLVTRSGVKGVRVVHERCTRNHDEYCDYRIEWLNFF